MDINGQGTEWLGNIAENFSRLSIAHERYRQTNDSRRKGDDIKMPCVMMRRVFLSFKQ